jgi:iron(III) transport system substrate-binding protein
VGIVNTYYLGRLKSEDPKNTLQVFWPQAQAGDEKSGVHVNIYGAGVIAGSTRADAARKLLAWMTEPEAQRLFADANFEYPANPQVQPNTLIKDWGSFTRSRFPLVKAGELQAAAVKLMDRAQYR